MRLKKVGKLSFIAQFTLPIVISLLFGQGLYAREKIAIIGSGLSGLTTAYEIVKGTQGDVEIDIYEGLDRVGGRTYTLRLDEGQVEAGASFINNEHTQILAMAKELGLDTTQLPGKKNRRFSYVIDGEMYSDEEIFKNLGPFFRNIEIDRLAMKENLFYFNRIEKMTVEDYLKYILIPRTAKSEKEKNLLMKIISSVMADEVGAPIENLHALHLFDQLEIDLIKNKFDPFGDTDEALKITGGNQMISEKIQEYLEARGVRFHFKHTLEKINIDPEGVVQLTINGESIIPSYAVITAPTNGILEHVEISPAVKALVQRRHKMRPLGFNTKYIIQVKSEFWKNYDFPTRFMGAYYQLWNSSEGGANTFTIYFNSNALKIMKEKNLTLEALAEQVVDEVGQFMPDFRREIVAITPTVDWKNNPFFGGSYSGARLRGAFIQDDRMVENRLGHLFFAGEQWTNIFPGFMEGSVRSGQAVASYIQASINTAANCQQLVHKFLINAI